MTPLTDQERIIAAQRATTEGRRFLADHPGFPLRGPADLDAILAEGTAMLNDLYNGAEVGEGRLARLLSLFRMDFQDPTVVTPDLAGRPVYLALAMTEKSQLRLKPQNLLMNLPLASRA
jgi:hypothetical protein